METVQLSPDAIPARTCFDNLIFPSPCFPIYYIFILSQCFVNPFKSFLEEDERMKKRKDERNEQVLNYIYFLDKIMRLVNKKGPKVYLMCEFNIYYEIVYIYTIFIYVHTHTHTQTWGEFVCVYTYIIFVS